MTWVVGIAVAWVLASVPAALMIGRKLREADR